MLQFIRSKVTSLVAKALFVLLIASFAVWGIGDIFVGSPAGKQAVEIGDEVSFTTQEVAMEFENARRRIGIPITSAQALELGLLEQVIEGIVTRGLLQAESAELELSASEPMMAEAIRTRFRDSLGQFDRTAYVAYLAQQGGNEAAVLASIRRDLARSQLVAAVLSSDAVPTPMVETLAKFHGQKRVAEVIIIPADRVAEPADPSADELNSFFEERKDAYTIPEYRSAAWVAISPDDLAVSMNVPEVDVRDAYDSRADQFGQPERRTIDQMLFDDEATAKTASDRITGGASYADIAKELLQFEQNELELGTLTKAELNAATADIVFSLSEGGISEPVQTDFGWHIFRVRNIEEGKLTPYEEVKEQLRLELGREMAVDKVYELSNQLEDLLAGGSTIEEAGAEMNLTVQVAESFDAGGRDKNGNPVPALPGGRFLEITFQTGIGEQSNLGDGANDSFFVLRVDGREESRSPSLDEVQAAVVADWKAERKLAIAEDRAESFRNLAENGVAMTEIATKEGADIVLLPAITRDGRGLPQGFSRAIPRALFDLKSVDNLDVIADDQGAALIRLAEVIEADGGPSEQKAQIAEQLKQSIEADVVDLLLAELRTRHTVKTEPALVRRLFADVAESEANDAN